MNLDKKRYYIPRLKMPKPTKRMTDVTKYNRKTKHKSNIIDE